MDDLDALREKLEELKQQHRELDAEIARLASEQSGDQLQMHPRFEQARSSDRALVLWASSLIALSTSAAIESSVVAGAIASIIAISYPRVLPWHVRIAQVVLTIALFASGTSELPLLAPLALLLGGLPYLAVTTFLSLSALIFSWPHLQILTAPFDLGLPMSSLGFAIAPTLALSVVYIRQVTPPRLILFLLWPIALLAVLTLGADRWFSPGLISNEWFRASGALAAALLVSLCSPRSMKQRGQFRWLVASVALGVVLTRLLPTDGITEVVFDESHGKWETVKASYQPTDFGRAANYTYSLLYKYADSIVRASSFDNEDDQLPSESALFILKMPSNALSSDFSARLTGWISRGGRLLVIADHTDLYDSTQNLNAFLRGLNFEIAATQVFDASGMLTEPTVRTSSSVVGRIDAFGGRFPWQTGASLKTVPWNAIQLASYGMSYAAAANYARPNRFGLFTPDLSFPFMSHTAIAAASYGRGAVFLVLDSTPWSNFSLFVAEYKRLFRSLIFAASHPAALKIWGCGAFLSLATAIIAAFWASRWSVIAAGLCFGLTVGCTSEIGKSSALNLVEGRDFGLKVVTGTDAHLRFLAQLVPIGERNFSRIVSSTSKYGLNPSASEPGSSDLDLHDSRKWLYIQPSIEQLPSTDDLREFLHGGGNLTVLFAPEQARDPRIQTWLSRLGLFIDRSIALSLVEDARPGSGGILNRHLVALQRDTRYRTSALATSQLREQQAETLFQSFTIRPTQLPPISGLLTLSFSADQFSDDAIGDVWEGAAPSALGRLREQQLSAILLDRDIPAPFPTDLIASDFADSEEAHGSYVMLENGRLVLSGAFVNSAAIAMHGAVVPDALTDPVGYLRALHATAVSFIRRNCPSEGRRTTCSQRLLGPDLIEWQVAWENRGEEIGGMELLHERTFSGLGATWNIVFSN